MELKKRLMLMLTLLLASFFLFGAGESLGCAPEEEEEEDCIDPDGCPPANAKPVIDDFLIYDEALVKSNLA